jgi:hypothetical protein
MLHLLFFVSSELIHVIPPKTTLSLSTPSSPLISFLLLICHNICDHALIEPAPKRTKWSDCSEKCIPLLRGRRVPYTKVISRQCYAYAGLCCMYSSTLHYITLHYVLTISLYIHYLALSHFIIQFNLLTSRVDSPSLPPLLSSSRSGGDGE